MTITPEALVNREVVHCVSYLVSTLAGSYGNRVPSDQEGMQSMLDQALDLFTPIDDWEEAAIQEGWRALPDEGNGAVWTRDEKQADADNGDGAPFCDSAQEACEFDHIEPYQREVFEHWIVSDWLADRLSEQGEKVDKDFAGLTVWARTTTGQGIANDSVIERICASLAKGA